MPTYLVLEKSYSNNEATFLYISQAPLDDLLSSLRRFYERTSEFQVYSLRLVESHAGRIPKLCTALGMEAKIPFRDRVTIYSNLYALYLDDLPVEQFHSEVARMKDYLDQKTMLFNQRQENEKTNQGDQNVENTNETDPG
jgi:hypothetical protein